MDAYGDQNSGSETSLAPESSFLIQSLRSIMTTGALASQKKYELVRTAVLKFRILRINTGSVMTVVVRSEKV